LEELGGYDCVNRSIMMVGAEGVARRDSIMTSLRETPPDVLGGEAVDELVDYWDEQRFGPFKSPTDQSSRNVLQIFSKSFVVTVRPSGTEPKLKLYCQLLPSGEPSGAQGRELLAEVRHRADAVARKIYNDLLARIEVSLSEAALMLNDIIDLDQKRQFDAALIPALERRLADTEGDLETLLAWLRDQSSGMTPGSDALPALKAPIVHLLDGRWADLARTELTAELERWARS
jgi:hypothetical protein